MLRRAYRWISREAGFRFIARRRVAVLVALATVALALGANSIAFSVTRVFLLSSLGIPDIDRVVAILPIRDVPGRGEVIFAEAYPNYVRIREAATVFTDVATFAPAVLSLQGDGETAPYFASRVTASFFTTLGVQPALGRAFTPEEEGPSPAPVAIISHALSRSLPADGPIIGRVLVLNAVPHTVVGVMPEGFTHPFPTDIWVPFDLASPTGWTGILGNRSLGVFGRLENGVGLAAGQAEADRLTQLALEASPDNRGFRYELQEVTESFLPGASRTVVIIQAGAALLVLLAITNLAGLFIAWGVDRRQEINVRLALGAPGRAVTRMLVLQSSVIVAAGGVAGVLLTRWAIPFVQRLDVSPVLSQMMGRLELDWLVIAVSCATIAVAGVLAGVAPALLATRADIATSLRVNGRSSTMSASAGRWQALALSAQAALSIMILSAAVLFGFSLRNIAEVDLGFEQRGQIAGRVQLDARYVSHASRVEFGERLRAHLEAEPALASGAFSTTLPVGDVPSGARFIKDPGLEAHTEGLLIHIRRVSPGYLETIGIPLVEGRSIVAADDTDNTPVAVISESLASTFWPGESAVGRRIYRLVPQSQPQAFDVVGVAADVLDTGYNTPPGQTVYVPWAQLSVPQLSIIAAPRAGTPEAVQAVRRALYATDPSLAANNLGPIESLTRQATALPRFQAGLLVAFGLVAITIVALGAFGVMSQFVVSHEREFAIRMLLGAAPGRIGASVMRRLVALVGAGVLVGVGAVLLGQRLLAPQLFGMDGRSAGVAALVTCIVCGITLTAALPTARRAMRVAPHNAWRA